MSKIVCVLGAPRSGTSLTAKILSLLGVYLGAEEYEKKANPGNPKGYWEHSQIHQLNNNILTHFGGHLQRSPLFPSDIESSSAFADFQERAQIIIQTEFTNSDLWGWKHPMTCLALPFWQRLFPSMYYVICIRNPFDCAASQKLYFNTTLEEGLYIWLIYLRSALKYTTYKPRILVSMEAWMTDWRSQLSNLTELLDQPMQPDVEGAVQAYIDKRLWHHKTTIGETEDNSRYHLSNEIVSAIEQVYESLSQNGLSEPGGLDNIFQQAIEIVEPKARQAEETWIRQLNKTTEELDTLISQDEAFILVDEDQLRSRIAGERVVIPFLEREGQYWGAPADGETAIKELDRLLCFDVSFIVFAWPAFWWLDYYIEFHQYLRSKFRCLLQNDHIVVFDLRS